MSLSFSKIIKVATWNLPHEQHGLLDPNCHNSGQTDGAAYLANSIILKNAWNLKPRCFKNKDGI